MFKTFIFWVGLPHEACHYLTACALGLSAQIESGYTSVERGSWWKEELVLLSPLVVGVVLVAMSTTQLVLSDTWRMRGIWFWLWIAAMAWMLACAKDVQDALTTWRDRESESVKLKQLELLRAVLEMNLSWDATERLSGSAKLSPRKPSQN
jgi:hypothetical protein